MRRALEYRFHPAAGRASRLARTSGCVRRVYNRTPTARTEAGARAETGGPRARARGPPPAVRRAAQRRSSRCLQVTHRVARG
ncbi:helix-turn-helix domain-containing protein [Actinomadura oligospora]|uniref:helix-turn-helix domain-containing protein n=1 Tax=Actinomadura oligospora TaxID=111804 RepID=UPI0014766312